MTDPAAARSGAAPQLDELIADWRERARLARPLESAPLTAEKRNRIAEWMDFTNRANELEAALAAARLAQQQENEQLKDRLGAERALGHGIGQEHTIAAVNTGGVDDLIAPRLDAARADAYPAYKREKALRCAAEAARTAHQQDLESLRGIAHAHASLTAVLAAAIGDDDRAGPYWEDGVRFLTARAHQAEAAVTALRQDLQALPRYAIVMKLHAFNVVSAASALRVDGEFIKASDLADRLAREEQATD